MVLATENRPRRRGAHHGPPAYYGKSIELRLSTFDSLKILVANRQYTNPANNCSKCANK